MSLPAAHSENDITTEPYRGPGPVVTGLGEGALQTKMMMLGGLFVGGVSAYLFHKPAEKLTSVIKSSVQSISESPVWVFKKIGQAGNWLLDIGKHSADAIGEVGFVKKSLDTLDKKRLEVAIDGGIVASAGGLVLGTITGGGAGAYQAHQGRAQVEALQKEAIDLRAKNAELKAKLEARTQSWVESVEADPETAQQAPLNR